MNRKAEFFLNDGRILKAQIPEGFNLQHESVYVFELDGLPEFGRFIRFCEKCCGASFCYEGKFLRIANDDDRHRLVSNREAEGRVREITLKYLSERDIYVSMVKTRFTVSRKRLTMTFCSDYKFDCGKISDLLEKRFQTKLVVEFLTPRDATVSIGGVGTCGCAFCCSKGLATEVDVKTARKQSVSLQSGAANGVCGKLKCCLSFET